MVRIFFSWPFCNFWEPCGLCANFLRKNSSHFWRQNLQSSSKHCTIHCKFTPKSHFPPQTIPKWKIGRKSNFGKGYPLWFCVQKDHFEKYCRKCIKKLCISFWERKFYFVKLSRFTVQKSSPSFVCTKFQEKHKNLIKVAKCCAPWNFIWTPGALKWCSSKSPDSGEQRYTHKKYSRRI